MITGKRAGLMLCEVMEGRHKTLEHVRSLYTKYDRKHAGNTSAVLDFYQKDLIFTETCWI